MIITSGHPKAGCHALVKACQLLGQNCSVEHIQFAQRRPMQRHVYIKRNPRDILVSWVRFIGQPVTQGTLLCAIDRFEAGPFADSLKAHEGWLDHPETHVVAFEHLVRDDLALREIAKYLEVPFLEDAFRALPGGTWSWTGRLSNWRDHWSDVVQGAWLKAGLDVTERKWGYHNG